MLRAKPLGDQSITEKLHQLVATSSRILAASGHDDLIWGRASDLMGFLPELTALHDDRLEVHVDIEPVVGAQQLLDVRIVPTCRRRISRRRRRPVAGSRNARRIRLRRTASATWAAVWVP